jgi:DNA polymerase I-like protein with 3'-5' exonuclease and polymerase domains
MILSKLIIIDLETPKIKNNDPRLPITALGLYPIDIDGAPQCHILDHSQMTDFSALEYFKMMFRNWTGTIIGHNLTFDIGVMLHNGFRFTEGTEYFDTMIALKHINCNESRYSLKAWGTYLGMKPWWFDMHKEWETKDTQDADIETLRSYNIGDLLATRLLYDYCKTELAKIPSVMATFKLENYIIPTVARTILHGFKVDPKRVLEKDREVCLEMARIEQEIAQEYGPINLASPAQVAILLYDKLGLKNPEGGRGTGKNVLKMLNHPVVTKLETHRGLKQQRKMFLAPLGAIPEKSELVGNMLYPPLNIHGARSGRFSSGEEEE